LPFGAYDRRLLERLRTAGVAGVYSSDGGTAREGAWLQGRNSLRHDLDRGWIGDVLTRTPRLYRSATRTAAKLVRLARI
jgi:hypothetical protein